MANNSDILIIGAGLIGLSTADHLLRRGYSVTVLDAASSPGAGASYCNSGMIHPSQARPWTEDEIDMDQIAAVHQMAVRSASLLKVQMAELGLADRQRPEGCLQLFDDPKLGEQAKADYEAVGGRADRYKGEWDFSRFALRFPDDASGNPYIYCHALFDDLLSRGVTFRFGHAAELSLKADRIRAIAGGKDYSAAHIVLAAGAHSKTITAPLNISIPIRPVRGFALNFSKPNIALPEIPVMHAESRSALTVFDDHVRLSGTVGEDDPKVLLTIWNKIAPKIVASLGQPTLSWSGDRPVSSLGRPIISQTPIDGLWVNAGHGHMGWTLCAASGEHLADLLAGEVKENPFAWA